MGEDDAVGQKKVVYLDDYRIPEPVGEWATYETDGKGNPVGDPIEKGLMYDENPHYLRAPRKL